MATGPEIRLPIVAPLNVDDNKVINVGTPTEARDAATMEYVDASGFPRFSATETYSAGEYVLRNDIPYISIVAVSAAAFDINQWRELGDSASQIQATAITEYSTTENYAVNHAVYVATGTNAGIYESLAANNRSNAVTDTALWRKITNFVSNAQVLKLTNIEDSADVNRTPAELKTAYESNSDTNAFTDANRAVVLASASEYDGTTTYADGALVFESTGTNTGLFRSLTANNVGVSLSDTVRWEKVTEFITDTQIAALHPAVTKGTATTTGNVMVDVNINETTQVVTPVLSTITAGSPEVTELSTVQATENELVNLTADDSNGNTAGYYFRVTGETTWTRIGASQSNAQIKTAYESNANTNAFTDADETRLDNSILANNGIVFQRQPGSSEAVTPPLIPIRGLVKSNGSLDGYQDRIYQNISGRELSVGGDGYITSVGNAPTTTATLEEGVASGDWEIYVNAGRYDATDNPNGHLGPEDISGFTEFTTLSEQTITPVYAFTQNFTSVTGQTSLILGRIPADLEIAPTTYTLTAVHPSGGTSVTVSIAVTGYNASTGTLTLASAITGLALGDNNLTFTKTGTVNVLDSDTVTVLESDAVSTDIEGDLSVNRVLRLRNVSTIDSGLAGTVWSDDGTLVLSGSTASEGGLSEDAPDWSGLSAYTVGDVVNFRNNIYKRRTQNIIATTGVSIVPGFTTLVSFKNNVGITGALGYADTFSFADPNIAAPALTSGVIYRFTIGSGSTQYVVDADPGSTDVTANVGTLYGNGLQSPATSAGRIWQLRLLTPTGTIAPGYTIVSVGDTVYTTAQQANAQTALLALLATKPTGTAIDNLDEGDQISFGGSPNTAPSEDVSWELVSNATLAPSRYDLFEGELLSFHQIPNGNTTASLNESDVQRTLFEGRVIGLFTVSFEALGDRAITDGTQIVTVPNGMATNFNTGDYITGRGASFPGIFVGRVVDNITGDADNAVRFRLTSLRQDNSEAIVALDDTTTVPGLGNLTRVGDIIQVARLEDVSPVTSIDEFNNTLIQDNSDQLPLGTNFEPSEQVTYLTSFAPRENVEYNGNFYFYIGPATHADFIHDAALRPQEFTNADFVPGNNKLNWVTYNEFINDISEADRSYSERIAATRDVTLHAQVRREIEAAKQDVLLTLSDRDSEREDQLVSLRPVWRVVNTRYDDGSRFRRNVLYNAISTAPSYTLTAGNRENTRGYNVFGSTGTVTFNGIIAAGGATVSGDVITILTPNGTALTQAQIATVEYSLAGRTINLLNRFGLVSYSASATAITFTYSSASLASFSHGEFLGAGGRLVIINTTQTTVNRKEASLCWVDFVEGSTRFTGEGLVTDGDGIIGRQELVSALDTTIPEDNNGVVLGIENSDTTVHYFNTAKPWDDDFFTATGDQAVHCTVSAGNTGAAGTTFNDTRVSALGAAQRFAWSARTYEDNPEDYFDLDPSANEYIIDSYNFAARAGGLVITGALLEPAVKSYSGFIWIVSNASNMSNEALHPQNRVVQTPFRNVNTIDLSQFQSAFNSSNALVAVAGVTQIQTLKMYGLTDTTIAAINSGNRVDFRFTLNEPGTESPPIYQLSTVGTTPYRTATSEIDVTFVDTTSQGVVALPLLSRFTWQLDARAAGTITRPTLATEAYTAANITAGTAVQGAFLGPHGILTNEPRYFQDSTKQWAAVTNVSREFNNSLFSRGEVISPDTVVRGSDGTYYKWAFRGVENRFGGSVVIRYDNVQVVRGSDGRFSSSSINPAPGNAGSIYDPASEDETVFDDEGTRTTDPIITLDNLNNLFQVNAVHPFTVEYDGYFNLAAGESATNASIIFGGTTTIGIGVTNFAELNRFVLMDPTALHAQATLVAGGSTNSQAIRDGHAFNNIWSVLEVDEVYPQYRSTEHNAIGAYQETTLQYSVDASRLQGTSIENASPGVGQVLRAVEIPDPADTDSSDGTDTIIQWQPGYAASTIPDHRTIPVTTSGADPFDLVDWQLTFGSGDDRVFEALAQTGSTGTIDTTLINLGEVLTVTFADGSIEQGHVFGGTTSTTRLFGQLTRRPVSSLLTNNVATATIRYYGDTAAESYVASPLTVNSDNEVIYDGEEITTANKRTPGLVFRGVGNPENWFAGGGTSRASEVIAGDQYINSSTGHSFERSATGLITATSGWSAASTIVSNTSTALNGLSITPNSASVPTVLTITPPVNADLVINANPIPGSAGSGNESVTIEGVTINDGAVAGITTINGAPVADADTLFMSAGYINAWITGTDTDGTTSFGLGFANTPVITYTNIQGDSRTWLFVPTLTITGTVANSNAAFAQGDGFWTRLTNSADAQTILAHPSTFLL